jgi:hypothetical protein
MEHSVHVHDPVETLNRQEFFARTVNSVATAPGLMGAGGHLGSW